MIRPYIGITGIENANQLEKILTVYSQKRNIPHLLMIGGLVSYKTLIGLKDKPITLMKDEVRSIFNELKNYSNEDVLFSLHYFTKPLYKIKPYLQEKAKSVVEKTLYEQIAQLFNEIYDDYERDQPAFQLGVQINISWPDPEDIKRLRDNYPLLKITLQVSDFSSLENIKRYNVDYILIDTSRGKGIEFDMNEVIEVYKIIKDNDVAVCFAGGFSPENVRKRVSDLREKVGTNNFSIDAEGRLRSNIYLDMEKVERYLRGAIEAFQ